MIVNVPRQLMIGSTPIDSKIFVFTGSPGAVKKLFFSGEANNDLIGANTPARGSIAKPLSILRRFIMINFLLDYFFKMLFYAIVSSYFLQRFLFYFQKET